MGLRAPGDLGDLEVAAALATCDHAGVTSATASALPVPREAAPMALFRRYPGLRAVPRAVLTELPTPVEPLALAGVRDGALWVKRDDRTSPVYGGNKARKLEFVLGSARARGTRRLVTTGGIGTHHGLATTVFGRQLGMATTLVLVPQPVTDHVREQLRAMQAFGAEIRGAHGVLGAALHVIAVLARSWLRGERPLLVPTGGSSAIGDIGFVAAAFELADQIAAGRLPEPAEIYVPVGSGGTLAGLVLGARLAGLRARIVGVLVTDILPPGPRRLAAQANATLALLRRFDAALPALRIEPSAFEVTRAQLGAGYGAATPAGDDAITRASRAGLALESTYTAKCLAEIVARLSDGRARSPVLFWNTYNSSDLSRHAPDTTPAPLPSTIQHWIAA
jgi:D-cysteine desulfhydrase